MSYCQGEIFTNTDPGQDHEVQPQKIKHLSIYACTGTNILTVCLSLTLALYNSQSTVE